MSAETVPMVKQFCVYSVSSRSRMASRRSLVLFSKAALSAYSMAPRRATRFAQAPRFARRSAELCVMGGGKVGT